MYLVLQVKRWLRDLSRYFCSSVFRGVIRGLLVYEFVIVDLLIFRYGHAQVEIRRESYMQAAGK